MQTTRYFDGYPLDDERDLRRESKIEEHKSREVIIENFYTSDDDFGLQKNSYIQVCEDKIRIFGADGELQRTIKNLKFNQAINVQQKYLYATSEENTGPIVLIDHQKEENNKEFIYLKQ